MEQRSRIIVPTGVDDRPAKLPSPYFNEETTLTARRVVPLAAQPAAAVELHAVSSSANAAPRRAGRIPLLALAIVAAVGLGVVGGLAIGLRRAAQHTMTQQAPLIVAPQTATATKQPAAVEQPATLPPPVIKTTVEPEVTAPEPTAQPDASIATEDRSKRDKEANSNKSSADKDSDSNRSSNKNSDTDRQVESTVVEARSRRQPKNDNQAEEARDQSDWRTQRDEDKPKPQRRTSDSQNTNQTTESVEEIGRRVRQELNRRIRDVFEGKPAQP